MSNREATHLVQIVRESWTHRMSDVEIVRQLELSGLAAADAPRAFEAITAGYKVGNTTGKTSDMAARNLAPGYEILFDAAFQLGQAEIHQPSMPTKDLEKFSSPLSRLTIAGRILLLIHLLGGMGGSALYICHLVPQLPTGSYPIVILIIPIGIACFISFLILAWLLERIGIKIYAK